MLFLHLIFFLIFTLEIILITEVRKQETPALLYAVKVSLKYMTIITMNFISYISYF